MNLEYNILNILILFGAIQGFILCAFLTRKRNLNVRAVDFFILFLFSLSFQNLIYAALDMDVFQYNRALHMFPFPYKWLIGLGIYFYIKNLFPPSEGTPYHIREWYLFVPALLYFVLHLYWFTIAIREDSYRITQVIVASDFFRINEFFYLSFAICLFIASLRWLHRHKHVAQQSTKARTSFNWYKRLTWVILIIYTFNLLTYSIDLVIHDGKESFTFLYPVLILIVFLIYWIGVMGFSKPNVFFFTFVSKQRHLRSEEQQLDTHIRETMVSNELFSNPKLTLHMVATQVGISHKELSKHINRVHQMNVSEYFNTFRIEKVKTLLSSSDAEKYTILTLAETAGFNSKSSFNAAFKKGTGMTPSQYRKSLTQS